MKKRIVHVTSKRSVQLFLPLAPVRTGPARGPVPAGMPPQPSVHELGKAFIRLAGALTQFIRAFWNLFVLWLVVPAAGAGLYWVLDQFKFAYPGVGLLVGMSLATQLLHRGADSLYRPTGQGLLCYFILVMLGHRREIFSVDGFAFDNLLDITLLARGEPITGYHWLGLILLGFSSALFDLRRFCSLSCPGHCLGGYRRHLHAAGGALQTLGAALLTLLSCLLALALKVAWVAFLKCKTAFATRKRALEPALAAQAHTTEQVIVIATDAQPHVRGELAAPVQTADSLLQPPSVDSLPISRHRIDAVTEKPNTTTHHQQHT